MAMRSAVNRDNGGSIPPVTALKSHSLTVKPSSDKGKTLGAIPSGTIQLP